MTLLLLAACDGEAGADGGMDAGAAPADAGPPPSVHDAFEVVADDGSATLTVAADSLPQGVSPADVRVRAVSAVPGLTLASELTPLAAYELLPDGLVFATPAALEFDCADDPAATVTPFGWLLGEDTVDIVDVEEVSRDPTTGRLLRARAPIAHFSHAMFPSHGDALTLTGAPLPAVGENQSFVAHVTGALPLGATRSTHGALEIDTEILPDVDWTLDVVGEVVMNVEPDGDAEVLEQSVTGRGGEQTVGVPLRCSAHGTMVADAHARAQARARHTIQRNFMEVASVMTSFAATRVDLDAPMQGVCAALSFTDPTGDCTVSTGAGEPCNLFPQHVDIVAFEVTERPVDAASCALFDEVDYPCTGAPGRESDAYCVTRIEPCQPMSALEYHIIVRLDAPIPPAPPHTLVYALVAESDDLSANDWVAHPSFPLDYFQGTDRWLELTWDPDATTWSLTATQVDDRQNRTEVPSSARAIVSRDTLSFVVNGAELPAGNLEYRVSAFATEDYDPLRWGGDVTGGDATEPLRSHP